MHIEPHVTYKARNLAFTIGLVLLSMLLGQPLSKAQTATWAGGNSFNPYGNPANWSPAGVPIGSTYTVIIPDSSSLIYNLGSNGVVDAVSLGVSSVFRLTNGYGVTVNGPALVKGQIDAGGAGSAFKAPANVTALQVNPRLYAWDGAQIQVGASTYTWDRYNAAATLLSSIGTNSLLDLKAVSSMAISYGDNGSWSYGINARSNGVIDLSSVSQITGPGQDDWLDFKIDTGGSIKFDLLRRTTGRLRYNIGVPAMSFPTLESCPGAYFTISSNSTVTLPGLLTYDSANISLGYGSLLFATNLNVIADVTLNMDAASTFRAPNLLSMDTVSVNLTNDATFNATNLTIYKNSDIPIFPGRDFQSGLLTNIDGSRLTVRGGSNYRLGAPSFAGPSDWRINTAFLGADGAGSTLIATNLKSLRVEGGSGTFTYSVLADNGGVLDLSALETAIGADPGNWSGNDWLAFTVRSNATLRLDSLRQVTRRTMFNVGIPRFELPSLESATDTTFNLPDGARLDVTNLNRLDACAISFGFNSTFNALKLTSLTDMDLNLGVGKLMIVPPLTNIYAARLGVSGGSSLHVSAPAYEVPQDWRWSPTLFSADGAGSLLDLAGLQYMRVYGGHNASWSYRVTADNSGVIDFSGLETIYGADPSNWGNDDWLEFNIRNGGGLLMPSLRQITRRTRWNIDIPEFTLPSVELVDNTVFNLANGTRLNLPSLTRLDNVSFSYGSGSTLNAPNLLNINNSALTIGSGQTIIVPPFTNINNARLTVTSGSNLVIAATTLETFADWRTSPTLLQADGVGSLLNASTLKSIKVYGGYGGSWNYAITANNEGQIDLSGLELATGGDPNSYDGDDWLSFNALAGGTINLNSLTQTVGHVRFNVGDNSQISAPALTRMQNSAIVLGFNSTMDASNLVEFIDSTLSLDPGKNLWVPGFTNIYASRFSVSGGSTFRIPALSYDMYSDWRWSPVLFSADGTGTLLDLSSIQTFRAQGGHNASWNYAVNAGNGAVIDLSGLSTVIGADPGAWGGDDWLSFNSSGAGTIRFGNVSVTRRMRFTATAGDSRLEFASLYTRPYTIINVNNRAILDIKGNFAFENTDPNNFTISGASVQMDGTQPQTLEVGGKNLGPTGATSLNFGYSQLIVGNSNQASIIKLQDLINNGQRGAGGESEALYLYGLDGQGLRLLNNSKLILNNVPVYALMGGQMRLLNSLVNPGTNSIVFDGGLLANMAGPRIISISPAVTVLPPISYVDVTFDIPIKASTFTVADVTITGPAGAVAATSVMPVAGNTYRISFAPQTVTGTYTLRVGPAINEAAENLLGMDQDADGLSGEASDDVYVGAFSVDGLPPVVVAAYGLQNGIRVGVTFNEPVSPAWATNPANYAVNGIAPTNAVLQTNGYQVSLWTSPVLGESFTLTLNNMVDLLGNTTNNTMTGTMLAMDARDIGNPALTGSTLTFDGTDFETVGVGSDFYWLTSDAGHFAGELRPGDFDVRVQVARFTRVDTYSQAGIMWRESFAGNARRIYACLNEPAGANRYWALIRYNPGTAGVEFPGNPGPAVGSLPAWIRLQRSGNTFIAYRGTDGTNWTEYGRVTVDFPTTGFVGLATDARNNTGAAYALYRYYGDITPSIVSQPQGQTVASGSNVVFGVTARGLPVLAYQWLFNGLPINNATNNLLQLNAVTTGNVGDYRVVITNSYGAVTSMVAALVVDGVGGGGFEGDVMPAPYGNNSVTVSDWSRIGRLVAGLDTPLSSSEFMRADCAPRTNAILGTLPLGDGRLSVADWAQAGRYTAVLDPLTAAGGPNQPQQGMRLFAASLGGAGELRSLRIISGKAAVGQTFAVAVELASAGDENAVGFSIDFDPARLGYVAVALAEGATGASLQVNASQAAEGRVGIALAKQAGQSFAAGSRAILTIQLKAIGPAGATALALGDTPVIREVASITAEPQSTEYQGGVVTIIEPGRLTLPIQLTDGAVRLQFTGAPAEAYRIEVSTDLQTWELLSVETADAEPIQITDSAAAQARHRFYRAVPQP